MRTLIFDIETVGEAWTGIDAVTQRILERPVMRQAEDPYEWVERSLDMQRELSLSPLTGSIIALGLYDLERAEGAVYYVGGEVNHTSKVPGFTTKTRNEATLLKEFWEGALSYDTFVTFSGRTFDVPFLYHRSIVHGIRPTKELMKYRYLSQQSAPYHIDLQDELTFYGAIRRQPLHLFCRAFGIDSNKESEITGADIQGLYEGGRHADIISYNIADVRATTALYEKWRANLAPASFLNTFDL